MKKKTSFFTIGFTAISYFILSSVFSVNAQENDQNNRYKKPNGTFPDTVRPSETTPIYHDTPPVTPPVRNEPNKPEMNNYPDRQNKQEDLQDTSGRRIQPGGAIDHDTVRKNTHPDSLRFRENDPYRKRPDRAYPNRNAGDSLKVNPRYKSSPESTPDPRTRKTAPEKKKDMILVPDSVAKKKNSPK
jgi:hypothetical protein